MHLFHQAVKGQELNKLISSQIEQALQRWDADKIGIPDYALESSGDCDYFSYLYTVFDGFADNTYSRGYKSNILLVISRK